MLGVDRAAAKAKRDGERSGTARPCGLTFELSGPWRRTPAGRGRTTSTMAWSGQTVAAVAGPRLSEGLGRTAHHRGLGLLMLPERSPPDRKASAVLRYSARPRHPTVSPQSAKALCVQGQRASPANGDRSAHGGVALVRPSQDARTTTLLRFTATLPMPCSLTARTRGCRECQRARALRWWKEATLAACRSGRPARAERVVFGTAR